MDDLSELLQDNEENSVSKVRSDMQVTMQKYASVYKSKDLLDKGFSKIEEILGKKIGINDKTLILNTDLLEALEYKNMIALAYVTISASLYREESRGSHYRYDFPDRDDDNWMYHTLTWLNDKNKLKNEKSDVNFNGLYEEMEIIPPAQRVY